MKELTGYYNKYKAQLLPIIFVLAGIIIFIQVILPSFSSIGSLNINIKTSEKNIQSLKDSAAFLSTLDESSLNQEVSLATTALPSSKDISAVYSALSFTSASLGMALTGFSVNVGSVFNKASPESTVSGIPKLSVNAQVGNTSKESLGAFTKALATAFPLNQINAISLSGGSGTLGISFFYKPYDLNKINQNNITPLSPVELNTLEILKKDAAKQ